MHAKQHDSLPVPCMCWWQQFLSHQRLPLCQEGDRNSPQRGDAQSCWHCHSSSPGCSHLRRGDCFWSNWTLKPDPCSWPCSKPVPPSRGVASHAWLAHPWSGETQSGRWALHQRWSSLGERGTDQTGITDLQNRVEENTNFFTFSAWWYRHALNHTNVSTHALTCTEMQLLQHTNLALQRMRGVCQSRRALRGWLPELKQSVAEREPCTPANIAYFM